MTIQSNITKLNGVELEQGQYKMVITAKKITVSPTDVRFERNGVKHGDRCQFVDAYFEDVIGNVTRRELDYREREKANRIMPRLACQIFESELDSLSDTEKKRFPIAQWAPNEPPRVLGLFPNSQIFAEEAIDQKTSKLLRGRQWMEYDYTRDGIKKQFVFYCWNVFSTVGFVKECLKRFGKEGDKFILIYQNKK